jgi:hypothetical protein
MASGGFKGQYKRTKPVFFAFERNSFEMTMMEILLHIVSQGQQVAEAPETPQIGCRAVSQITSRHEGTPLVLVSAFWRRGGTSPLLLSTDRRLERQRVEKVYSGQP